MSSVLRRRLTGSSLLFDALLPHLEVKSLFVCRIQAWGSLLPYVQFKHRIIQSIDEVVACHHLRALSSSFGNASAVRQWMPECRCCRDSLGLLHRHFASIWYFSGWEEPLKRWGNFWISFATYNPTGHELLPYPEFLSEMQVALLCSTCWKWCSYETVRGTSRMLWSCQTWVVLGTSSAYRAIWLPTAFPVRKSLNRKDI